MIQTLLKPLLGFLTFLLLLSLQACNSSGNTKTERPKYGNHAESGQYVARGNSKVYFETYGDRQNPALLLIHGNGGSIASMELQIAHFMKDHYVVVGDNRTHGKSGGVEVLNYELMAEDYIAIMDQLKLERVSVLGHSDGGIIGLLMAMQHPDRLDKLVAAVPNLTPGPEAIAEWELEMSTGYVVYIDSMLQAGDRSRDWQREYQHMKLLFDEPNIAKSDLSKVSCPVLVMTSDEDIIKPRHILEIYESLPEAQLFVMPGATHFMIREEAELYNMMAHRFLTQPFKRPTSKESLLKLIE